MTKEMLFVWYIPGSLRSFCFESQIPTIFNKQLNLLRKVFHLLYVKISQFLTTLKGHCRDQKSHTSTEPQVSDPWYNNTLVLLYILYYYIVLEQAIKWKQHVSQQTPDQMCKIFLNAYPEAHSIVGDIDNKGFSLSISHIQAKQDSWKGWTLSKDFTEIISGGESSHFISQHTQCFDLCFVWILSDNHLEIDDFWVLQASPLHFLLDFE